MTRTPLPPAFRRLWSSTIVSNFGDGLRLTALPLLAASLTRDPVAIGAVSAATTVPWLLGPIGGAMVDRGDRVRLMVVGQAIRGFAVLALSIAVAVEVHQLWLVYAVAVLIGLGEVVVDSAAQALVPALIDEPDLERANGQMSAGITVTGEVVGGPVGGLLFAFGATVPFLVDAVSFGVAGLLLAGLKLPERRRSRTGTSSADRRAAPREVGDRRRAADVPPVGLASGAVTATTTFWQDVGAGMLTLWKDRLLRDLAVIVGLVNVAVTGSLSILVLLALGELGLTEVGFGLLLGAGAVGGLTGALLAERLRRAVGRPMSLASASISVTVGMAVLSRATTPAVAAIGMAIIALASGVFNVIGLSLRHAIIPPAMLGRVIASFRVIGIGGVPVGAFLGGMIARATDVRTAMSCSVVLLMLVTAGMFRTVRRIPAEHR